MPLTPTDLAAQADLVAQAAGLDRAEVEMFIVAAHTYHETMDGTPVPTTTPSTLSELREMLARIADRRRATADFQDALARYTAHVESRG